jgi:hypothetical protein
MIAPFNVGNAPLMVEARGIELIIAAAGGAKPEQSLVMTSPT